MKEEYFKYADDTKKTDKICKCNVKCWSYNNVSTQNTVYTCGKSWDEFLKSKGKATPKEEKEIISCNYRLEIKYHSPPIVSKKISYSYPRFIYDKIKYTPIIETREKKINNIKNKVEFFLFEKKYRTFQEIEFLCKDLNIPIYNHLKEDLNDFCDRLLKLN